MSLKTPIIILAILSLFSAALFSQTVNSREMWISRNEIAGLPVSGTAWVNLKAEADKSTGTPNLANQDDPVNVRVLAKALVYARTGVESYRTEVIAACMAAINTEKGGRTLAIARELAAYVIAADLVGMPADKDIIFRAWLRTTLTEILDGKTLQSTHEERPNNWGTHAGASRAAVAIYLGDKAELARTAQIFKGWLGDRSSYAGFTYGDLSWQSNQSNPVGINPKGSTISGHNVDGVLPDDQRRAGGFIWPAPKENYVWEALQGALVQAVLLYRAGYDVWNWQDKAILRAVEWLHQINNYPAQTEDNWQPHIINYYYGSSYPAAVPTSPGKNMGWADWTHQKRVISTNYTINVVSIGNGTVAVNPAGGSYAAGTPITLRAVSANGCSFINWSGSVTGTNPTVTITVDANKQINANFTAGTARMYSLSISTTGSGSITLNPAGPSYPEGTVVTLTAKPATGYSFSNWSGGLSGSINPTTITMNGDKSVGAIFTASASTGQIIFKESKSGGSGKSKTVSTLTNVIGVTGDLYLAAISTKSYAAVTAMSGLGLTWKRLDAQISGRSQTGVDLWYAKGTVNGDGKVTATLAKTPTNASIVVTRYSGMVAANPIVRILSANTNGVDGASSGGTDNASYSPSINITSPDATIFVAAAKRNTSHNPGSGYQERIEYDFGSGGDMAALAIEDKLVAIAGSTPITGQFSANVDWAVVAVELTPGTKLPKLASEQDSDVDQSQLLKPSTYSLEQNYPNPFNPVTTISYSLPKEEIVTLVVYDLQGRNLGMLVNGVQSAGTHSLIWNANEQSGQSLASGLYFYRLTAGSYHQSKSMTLMK